MTVPEIAAQLQCSPRTVRKWAAALGYERIGRDYHLTDEQVDAIRDHLQDGPGWPLGRKRK